MSGKRQDRRDAAAARGQEARWAGHRNLISAGGTVVTDTFRLYLRPLLGSGLPDAFRLRGARVPEVLQPAA